MISIVIEELRSFKTSRIIPSGINQLSLWTANRIIAGYDGLSKEKQEYLDFKYAKLEKAFLHPTKQTLLQFLEGEIIDKRILNWFTWDKEKKCYLLKSVAGQITEYFPIDEREDKAFWEENKYNWILTTHRYPWR